MNDQLLSWLSQYGLPALFAILTVASAGVPMPVTLLLVVTGSFVAQGELNLWEVLIVGSAGAIAGDQIGYFLGRFGGRGLVHRLTKNKAEERLKRAEEFTLKWGGAGIFFSRWLITPLGPWLNFTSGIAGYSWPHFLFWDVLGEILWVALYVILGKIFNDNVQELADLLGNLTWVLIGLLITIFLGWKLFRYFRNSDNTEAAGNISNYSNEEVS